MTSLTVAGGAVLATCSYSDNSYMCFVILFKTALLLKQIIRSDHPGKQTSKHFYCSTALVGLAKACPNIKCRLG